MKNHMSLSAVSNNRDKEGRPNTDTYNSTHAEDRQTDKSLNESIH